MLCWVIRCVLLGIRHAYRTVRHLLLGMSRMHYRVIKHILLGIIRHALLSTRYIYIFRNMLTLVPLSMLALPPVNSRHFDSRSHSLYVYLPS